MRGIRTVLLKVHWKRASEMISGMDIWASKYDLCTKEKFFSIMSLRGNHTCTEIWAFRHGSIPINWRVKVFTHAAVFFKKFDVVRRSQSYWHPESSKNSVDLFSLVDNVHDALHCPIDRVPSSWNWTQHVYMPQNVFTLSAACVGSPCLFHMELDYLNRLLEACAYSSFFSAGRKLLVAARFSVWAAQQWYDLNCIVAIAPS